MKIWKITVFKFLFLLVSTLSFGDEKGIFSKEINWYSWEEGLKLAKSSKKLILLDIYADWCHWCNVMENTTYRNKEVIKLINKYYIPIRVNSELYPEINLKYNQGGLPSTVILDWNGNIIWGAIYVSPEEMIKILDKFHKLNYEDIKKYIKKYKIKKKFKYRLTFKSLKRKELNYKYIDKIYKYIKFKFDYINGGFKGSPKFPRTDLAYFLLYNYFFNKKGYKLLTKTLEGYSELIDKEEGGIFRYGTKENWEEPHYEKLLKDQAELSILFFNAYAILNNRDYKDKANLLIKFTKRKLFNKDDNLFYNSQGADIVDDNGNLIVSGEDYFIHNLEKRKEIERKVGLSPNIERRYLYSTNSLMANALIYSYLFNNNLEDLKLAEKIVDKLYKTGFKEKGLIYGKGIEKYYLKTQVYYLETLTNLYEITGKKKYLVIAKRLVKILDKYYFNKKIGIYTDLGNVYIPLKKISFVNDYINLNVRISYILQKLYLLTYKDKYKKRFKNLLSVLPTKSNIDTAIGYFYYLFPLINVKGFDIESKDISNVKKFFPKWLVIQTINSDLEKKKLGYGNIKGKRILICNMNLCFKSLKDTKKVNKIVEDILKNYRQVNRDG